MPFPSVLPNALAVLGTLFLAGQASAQNWRFQFHSGGWPQHSEPHVHPHTPDLGTLDRHSDKLSKIVQHLHDDAHDLSQHYHHSASIEHSVSELDYLKRHMHEVLHQASRHHRYTSSLDRHIKRDLQRAKQLLHELEEELAHQSRDGIRRSDFQTVQHMREVILQEAYPWIQLMESEVYGGGHHEHRGDRRVIAQPRFERHASPRPSGFRFSF